ncbi:hypothetical protein CRM22_009527 [Opisthorchis felineus]|uniref:Uncharacterized protein n=1 Tax=Opisthorchis felineus TaxID=147828 RepID=A0A4S2L6P5_OPIFE|nr:hypothetical protein CRM22_009527 [Opisthorchis felineus]
MMEAKLSEIDPNKLSGAELQFEISKYTRLKQTLASRLPDGGARLDRYLTRLHGALNEKTQTTSLHFLPKTVPRSEPISSKMTLKKCDSVVGSTESPDVIDADSTELCESQIPDVDALSKRMSSLDIQSDPQSSPSDSDTTCIGTLNSHEVTQILYTLNLPSLLLSCIQWFILALRFSGQFVHLVVFDCESSDRYLFRTGLRAIWFPGSPRCKSTEAPLELHILRQLKTSCALINETMEMHFCRPSLEAVPDSILRRLASVGLGRTRLTRLAGLYGWQGFSGLLSFKLTSYSDSRNETARPFVTNSLDVLQVLYRFFRHVYDHFSRHLRLHMGEEKIHFKRNTLGPEPFLYSAMTTETKTSAQSKLLAWTAGGNTMLDPAGDRHSQCLDMDQSIELMQKVQRQFQEARVKHSLPSYPSLPSPSIKLESFRESRAHDLLSDDSTDTSSDAESSSGHSQASLGLEDVD